MNTTQKNAVRQLFHERFPQVDDVVVFDSKVGLVRDNCSLFIDFSPALIMKTPQRFSLRLVSEDGECLESLFVDVPDASGLGQLFEVIDARLTNVRKFVDAEPFSVVVLKSGRSQVFSNGVFTSVTVEGIRYLSGRKVVDKPITENDRPWFVVNFTGKMGGVTSGQVLADGCGSWMPLMNKANMLRFFSCDVKLTPQDKEMLAAAISCFVETLEKG